MNPKPAALLPVVSFEDVSKVYGKDQAVDRLSLGNGPALRVAWWRRRYLAASRPSPAVARWAARAGPGCWPGSRRGSS